MAFGFKRISNNNIDTNTLKLGDLLGVKIIPNEIGIGIDNIREYECIINDFVRYDDKFIPTVMFLCEEECILSLNDKRIKSFIKLGELNNTHILQPYSSYGHNDVSVDINSIKEVGK